MKILPQEKLPRFSILFNMFVSLCLLNSTSLMAQSELICDGEVHTVAATGALEDFVLPTDSDITQIELVAHGGDGGFADLGNCNSEGGAGAHLSVIFNLGSEEGAIPYGSTVRFIVGIAGEKGTGGTVLGTGSTYGGGGGGTGILFKAPDSDEWKLLAVAGGGGGAYQGSLVGICVNSKTGQGGRSGFNGGDGNGANGGKGGLNGAGGMAGGLDGFEVSGGGGGQSTRGEGITCVNLDGSNEVAEGQLGFPNGGAGGGNEGCAGSTFRDGGFGFGGGASGQGGGGGGGGFSGGGGGGSAGRGGGGGSFIIASGLNPVIEEGGLTALTEDGFAQYRCIKRAEPEVEAPVANCIDSVIVVALNADGMSTVVPSLLTPDTLSPALTYSVSPSEFTCDSLGARTLTFLVKDSENRADSCTVTVSIVDQQAPELDCPVSVEVSCETDYTIDALGVATAIDNCGESDLALVETSITGDCPQTQTITRTWTATDVSGNASSCEQVIVVSDGVAPTCENCPEDVTVNCDAVPELPELQLVDNCDANPTVETTISSTQLEDGSCGTYTYTETRTFTISDACGNSTDYVQVITVLDEMAPLCLNCPEDISVSCESVPEIPELEVSDNCDPNPTVEVNISSTQLEDGSCGTYTYTETRTFTISDACGNSVEHVQVITVEDTTAPEITCPPTITVTCDNDPSEAGYPDVVDNCDPSASIDYDDVVLSGDCDWACMIERSWMATDACGNTSTCVQTIEQSVLELIEDAISEDLDGDGLADPFIIGRLSRHSLTVTMEGAACLLGWMPNNGGKAWPLVRTDFQIDGSDCAPDGLPIGADGKLNNPLISETLILGLKLRLDPTVGEPLLADLDCDFNPIIFQGLPRNPTVADLYHQANLVVGNIFGLPFTQHFADALACINGLSGNGLCPEEAPEIFGGVESYPAYQASIHTQSPVQVGIHPNPAREQVWLDLSSFNGQTGELRLFNSVGQIVLDRRLNEISTEPMSLHLGNLSNGLYLLHLRIGGVVLTEQVVVQR